MFAKDQHLKSEAAVVTDKSSYSGHETCEQKIEERMALRIDEKR